jgi:hypothetical protein
LPGKHGPHSAAINCPSQAGDNAQRFFGLDCLFGDFAGGDASEWEFLAQPIFLNGLVEEGRAKAFCALTMPESVVSGSTGITRALRVAEQS